MKLKLYKKQYPDETIIYHIGKDGVCIFSTTDEITARKRFDALKNYEEETILEEWDSEQKDEFEIASSSGNLTLRRKIMD